MKIFISADIEGTTGIAHWNETNKKQADYHYFQEQMTREVSDACTGAIADGAREIWIKDAHGSGRNIDPSKLPENIKLIRGWSGHPYMMVQELDETFDALMYTGYHSYGSSNTNPLSHTMNSSMVDYVKLNDIYCSEFLLHSYVAAYLGVPVVFLSGDKGLCEHVKSVNENIVTVAVNEGVGDSTISMQPDVAIRLISEGVEKALKGDLEKCKINLPDKFHLEIRYNHHVDAFKNSFYPGVVQKSPKSITFDTDDYFEIMRAALFLI